MSVESPTREEALQTLANFLRPQLEANPELLASLISDQQLSDSSFGNAATKFAPKQSFWDWAEQNFYIDETRQPIRAFPHQRVIMRLMFEWALPTLHCQTLLYSTLKKSGKTAIGAAVARWIAECWGHAGEIFTLANSLDQAKGRTYAAVEESLTLDPRFNRISRNMPGLWHVTDKFARYLPENSVITPIANSHKGAAGSNPSASIYSELWGYNSKEDLKLWAEMAPSPIRPWSIRFIETYAGYSGESEILYGLYKVVVENGRRLTEQDCPDWPFPEDFAPPPTHSEEYQRGDRSQLPFFVNENAGIFAYWDTGLSARRMPWQRGERGEAYYRQEAATQTPEQFDRLHNNYWTSGAQSFIPPAWFDACNIFNSTSASEFTELNLGVPNNDSTPVVIAADASVSGDCSGLIMVRRDPRDPSKPIIVQAKEWTPSKGSPMNYSLTIEPTIRQWITGHTHPTDPAHKQDCNDHQYIEQLGVCIPTQPHNCVQIAYDAYQLHDMMTRLSMEQIAWCNAFSQNSARMIADKQLYDMVCNRRLLHTGDPTLRQHFLNASRKENPKDNSQMRIVKKSADAKIDLAVCASMGVSETMRLML